MATYSGVIVPAYLDGFVVNPNGTSNLDGRTVDRWDAYSGWDPGEEILVGTLVDNQPVPGFPATVFGGQRVCSFFDDMYNRIYFFPGALDFGAVTEDTSQPVLIWNAYLQPVVLDNIVEVNGEGVDILGPPAPATILPLATSQYDVVAYADGPATIDSAFEFSFTPGGNFTLPVAGNRAQLWPFRPNWAQPYRVTYEFSTDILSSHAGKEQRRALRQTPRKALEHTCLLRDRSELRRFKDLMATWQHRVWVFPELPRRAVSNTGMPANAITMGFPEVPTWVQPGTTVVLRFKDSLELRVVDSVVATDVLFTNGTETVWPVGTLLHPGLAGRLNAQIQAPRRTNTVAEVRVRFTMDPGSSPPDVVPAPDATVKGREVFLKKPNWAEPVQTVYQHDTEEVDFGYGRTATFSPVDFGTITQQAAYVNRDSDEAEAVLAFYTRLRGQQGEFYMPTWEFDMDLAQPVSIATNTIRMAGTKLYQDYKGDTVHRGIFLRFRDGTVLFRAVTAISEVSDELGDDTLLTVDDPWAEVFGPEDVLMVSWLLPWRLASDGLTMDWVTNSVAQAQLAMKSLEDLAEEVQP